MPCLFALFAASFPRLVALSVWKVRPTYFSAAFGESRLWPILGITILPITTLMYVLRWSASGLTGWDWFWQVLASQPGPQARPDRRLSGWDWFWLVLAVFFDLLHYASSSHAKRDRTPADSAA